MCDPRDSVPEGPQMMTGGESTGILHRLEFWSKTKWIFCRELICVVLEGMSSPREALTNSANVTFGNKKNSRENSFASNARLAVEIY
jgi:hypothetical protein